MIFYTFTKPCQFKKFRIKSMSKLNMWIDDYYNQGTSFILDEIHFSFKKTTQQ